MEISAALAANLDLLTDALNDPDVDLVDVLRLTARDAKTAVDSFVGLSLKIANGGQQISFAALQPGSGPRSVVSSMLLPLLTSSVGDVDGETSLVLYAGRAGAFVDLAADLAWLTGQSLRAFTIDAHLVVPTDAGSLDALREASVINQAVGVLVGCGYTLADAERELDARAVAAATTSYAIANLILTFPPDGPSAGRESR